MDWVFLNMSNNAASKSLPPCRSLQDYLVQLISRLREADTDAYRALRRLVGDRCACIVVDREAILIQFRAGEFLATGRNADFTSDDPVARGVTTRQTVLALMNGYQDLSEAIHLGALDMIGLAEDIVIMGQAIEILMDASARTAALQDLGNDYRRDPCLPPFNGVQTYLRQRRPRERTAAREYKLLKRLDLLK